MSGSLATRTYLEGEGGDDLSDFGVLVSYRFQKHIQGVIETRHRRKIYECIQDLIENREGWKQRRVKKPQHAPPTRSVRMAAVNEDIRLIFDGPLRSNLSQKPVLFVHDFCNHDELARYLRRIVRRDLDEATFVELDAGDFLEIPENDLNSIGEDTVAFAKPIPALYFAAPEKIDSILKSEKASIRLTEKQLDVLYSSRPLLINGEAGTGKTTILCHRLALSILSQRQLGVREPILYLSYNQRLIDQARKDVQEILRELHDEDDDVSNCEFVPFQMFLKRYVPNPDFFDDRNYVSFGRFKRLYEVHSRGSGAGVGSPELAWHVIRSILKGSCIPPDRPPIARERYEELGRKRQEIESSQFESFYRTGLWYQEKTLKEKGLWDDQDLAWVAFQWIRKEMRRNPDDVKLFSEIFCDEIQDLTELEFRILLSLCHSPAPYDLEGVPLVLAGDPLQTINPTGFRWSVLRSEIYRVEGKSVQLHQLRENWRSDRRIVEFANCIQETRSAYLQQKFSPQAAFEKEGEGDYPRVIVLQDEGTTNIPSALERNLKVRSSALIIWNEDNEAVTQFLQEDSVLGKLSQRVPRESLDKKMAALHLYTVSDAKGLEFRIVILYKFGEHPEVRRWWSWMRPRQQPSQDEKIPLLYFLNRLYISITRAQSYLFIIDSPVAVERFWSQWEGVISHQSPAEFHQVIEQHVTLERHEWEEQGDKQFEHAEKTKDIRNYERSLESYLKAGADKKATKAEARIAELEEEWESAGNSYLKINERYEAVACFERGKKWKRAIEVYEELPSDVWRSRHLAYCRFRNGCSDPQLDCRKAALKLSQYVQSDEGIQAEYIWELADKLHELREYEHAGTNYERLYREFHDTKAGVETGKCWRRLRQYDKALQIFRECNYYETEFVECLQEKAESLENADKLREAADAYGQLGRWRRDAYHKQGLCLYKIKDYREALGAFVQGGYRGVERHMCEAEVALQEGDVLKAVKLFNDHEKYERTIKVVREPVKARLLPHVAAAHYHLKHYYAAERFLGTLISREMDLRKRNEYYTLRGHCQAELGWKKKAYDSYVNGQAYDKAIPLAEELSRPEGEVKQLRAAYAEKKGDLDTAIALREELGEDLKVASLKGYRSMEHGRYREAISHFIQADEGKQVLNCIAGEYLSLEDKRRGLLFALVAMSEKERDNIREWMVKQDDSDVKGFIDFFREQAELFQSRARDEVMAKRCYEELKQLQLMAIRGYKNNNDYEKIVEAGKDQGDPEIAIFVIEAYFLLKEHDRAQEMFSDLVPWLKDKKESRELSILEKAIQLAEQLECSEQTIAELRAIAAEEQGVIYETIHWWPKNGGETDSVIGHII